MKTDTNIVPPPESLPLAALIKQASKGPFRIAHDGALVSDHSPHGGESQIIAPGFEVCLPGDRELICRLLNHGPAAVAKLAELALIFEGIRDDQISQDMEPSRLTQAEREERLRILDGFVRENCAKIDDALDGVPALLAALVVPRVE